MGSKQAPEGARPDQGDTVPSAYRSPPRVDRGALHRQYGSSLPARLIEAVRAEGSRTDDAGQVTDDLALRFEEVARTLREIDVEAVWAEATERERKVLIDELLEAIAFFPDHSR